MSSLAVDLATDLATDLARSVLTDPDEILLAQGSAVRHWWEPRAGLTSLNVDNISEISPLAGSDPMAQALTGGQPEWLEADINGRPAINLQDTARHLAATVAIAGGHRLGLFCVMAFDGPSRTAMSSSSVGGQFVYELLSSAGGARSYRLRDDGATAEQASGGAIDTSYHLLSNLPLSTGWLAEIDGVPETVTPYTRSGTIEDLVELSIGRVLSASSGGKVSSLFFIDLAADESARIAAAEQYVAAQFGISIA